MYCECYFEGIRQVGSCFRIARGNLRAGVTLAELMITLCIICILACIALPGMTAYSSRKAIIIQADQFSAFFHPAREHALQEGMYWKISFVSAEGYCFAFGDTNGNSKYDAGEKRLGPLSLARGIRFGCNAHKGPNNTDLPDDGISFADNRISFSPLGGCNSGTLYLRTQDRSVGLRVLPATGTVLVYEHIKSWSLLR